MNLNSINRRHFIKVGATAAVAAATLRSANGLFAAADYGPRKLPWAIQLYTVSADFNRDPAACFAHLAEIGYKGVEFAGYAGRDANTLRKMLDDAGLKAVGTHIGLNTMQGDALPATIEFSQILGLKRIGVSQTNAAAALGSTLIPGFTEAQVTAAGTTARLTKLNQDLAAARAALNSSIYAPTMDRAGIDARVKAVSQIELDLAMARAETLSKVQSGPNKLNAEQLTALAGGGRGGRAGGGGARGGGGPAISTATKAEWEAVGDIFSGIAAKLKPVGMEVYYHCHPPDFALIDGVSQWEVMFSHASRDVKMEIDLGHAGTAGQNQPALMAKYPVRTPLVHVKPANGGGGKLVGDATDTNNWPAIFAACEDPKIGGTEWYILEYDGGNMDQAERTIARMKEWGKA